MTGRGEVMRILLNGCHKNDVEFTDTRISFPEWPTVKPTLPLGQVPVLSIDGSTVTQSSSLYRYCAKLVDLYPSDPFQALVVDETIDVLNEILAKQQQQGSETDEEYKMKRHEFRDTIMKQGFSLIESRIEQYGCADTTTTNTTVCGVPSVADVFIMTFVDALHTNILDHIDGTILTDFPHFVKVADTARKLPIVVSYNDKK